MTTGGKPLSPAGFDHSHKKEEKMVKILFICHGNICRSTMGEYILKDLVKKAGREAEFEIDSAAVSREEIGNPIYPPARRELTRRGVAIGDHRARQVTMEDYRHFDRIYFMDESNRRYLQRLLPQDPEKIQKLLPRDVADPWYTGDFAQTYEDLMEGCQNILEEFS